MKVAPSAVTASQSAEECIVTETPSGSAAQSEGASGSEDASGFKEVSGSEEASTPATASQSASSDEANIYTDIKLPNDKGVMTRTLTLERQVLTRSPPTMPAIHEIFTRHRLEWKARDVGRYSEEMVREIYALYVATLRSQLDWRAAPAKHAPLDYVRVRGKRVDISLPAIRRYLYGADVDATRTPLIDKFDYRWKLIKDGWFQRAPELRETTKQWIAQYLSGDGEAADWVLEPNGSIKKSNLTFTTKFEVYFTWLLQAVMHERAFKATTTYPFSCMVFSSCMLPRVPVWHINVLKTSHGTVDIGLIRDESNELALHRGLRANLEAAHLSELSCLNPSATLVSLSRVQKLKTQMATLLHHIQPWMQRSIVKADEHLERKMAQHNKRKVMEDAVESLRADFDSILKARVPKSKAPSTETVEDTVLVALFSTTSVPPPPPRERAKRHRTRDEDESRSWKKERHELEAARRASLIDKEARQLRDIELDAGASSSRVVEAVRSTTDGDVIAEDTTDGVPTSKGAGSGKSDLPTC
ncbi:hypothetical protein EJD97_014822 [Solanum chilense]|uniref:Uncharacterized protein n=1 Tax=Solanum chilense TaxID=4083 RepID=A0A6N2C7Q5_SOLCI|nr:hypothetical protein EJD97_014822 [Solanum chilense]